MLRGVSEPREAASRLLLVVLAGGVGSGARYLMSEAVQRQLGPAFPYGTLAVNLLGSCLMGAVMYAGAEAGALSPTLRLTLATGLLGGFTTYSAFSYETLRQLNAGAWGAAALHVLSTLLGCLAACVLGWTLARWALGG